MFKAKPDPKGNNGETYREFNDDGSCAVANDRYRIDETENGDGVRRGRRGSLD